LLQVAVVVEVQYLQLLAVLAGLTVAALVEQEERQLLEQQEQQTPEVEVEVEAQPIQQVQLVLMVEMVVRALLLFVTQLLK
jgi:hypothetical protein